MLETPASFAAIGQFYGDFGQTPDDEVVRLLERAPAGARPGADARRRRRRGDGRRRGRCASPGHLTVPARRGRIVLFAHGSGSSRHSSRNRYVADVLNRAGLGTLLFDLLTADEERDRANVFDIELLAGRLVAATTLGARASRACAAMLGRLLRREHRRGGGAVGRTDAPVPVSAVVSRAAVPTSPGPRLAAVRAPTLLIVGGNDTEVLELNRQAAAQLRCDKTDPGRSRRDATSSRSRARWPRRPGLARDWFLRYLDPECRATG